MSSITLKAFAKVNLGLRIKSKRPDGFHEVVTILQAIDLADRLRVEARRGPFQIVCSTPGVPLDRSNLIWRAAERLWTAAGHDGGPRDVAIALEKHIPMQAGLGGGSSDAAGALVALRKLWKLRIADEELVAIGASLGSDVPFFFVGGTALGLGRGEEVYPLADLPRWWAVLVFPRFGVSTADAYGWLALSRTAPSTASPPMAPRYLARTWLGRMIPLVNDLEPPVAERHPSIARLTDQLMGFGAEMAAMSGSGSTVFGIFSNAKAAGSAAARLRRGGDNAQVVRLLPRRSLPGARRIG